MQTREGAGNKVFVCACVFSHFPLIYIMVYRGIMVEQLVGKPRSLLTVDSGYLMA